ncbi:hypothetical protein EMIHUDRAFT_227247 [Emiliania huxleyi CCMP1516]|uniref:Uncharacterized protein n=2 Tax=Emiliania huxleyi TaxID=2903 RepID=A0A0D3KIZ7_EMIH1|nr:hypothetical protein EMIHUDRAFT_227247 [Emiliania huxleyi CCMP1516]EOD35732.1 hypothetical protein EMIHUDRAFT_227247 [Emiliania huxleyi CCMP1516]|eukprot:XP_005788161.1 hypothetical protein EMIHUDRAFT_227247 [Emiliania huxleyi CCMP1516]
MLAGERLPFTCEGHTTSYEGETVTGVKNSAAVVDGQAYPIIQSNGDFDEAAGAESIAQSNGDFDEAAGASSYRPSPGAIKCLGNRRTSKERHERTGTATGGIFDEITGCTYFNRKAA